MRYEAHPVFAAPVNADATIWRYMDFAKLVSLLKTRSLYFARVDALGDEFEGFYSRANIEMRPAVYHDKIPETTLAEISAFTESQRKRTFVNCWNLSEYESGALWGLYVPPHGGVAIRSTFRRLTQCFQRTPEDHAPGGAHEIYIGQVEYADYDSAWLPEGNTLWPFVFKRRSFDFEMELRACHQILPPADVPESQEGIAFPVDLESLVDAIVVSPVAPGWFSKLVASVCARYELDKPVEASDLAGRPVY